LFIHTSPGHRQLALPCVYERGVGKRILFDEFYAGLQRAQFKFIHNSVAKEDNTTVKITPSANTKNGCVANSVSAVSLNKGRTCQVLGALDGANATAGANLTGTHVRSISSGTGGCKKIAVFSVTGKVRIPQNCNATSSENLYQQLYPTVSWGKIFDGAKRQ
jgi:hypothetical protein